MPFRTTCVDDNSAQGHYFDTIDVDSYDKTESRLLISRGAAMVPVLIQANDNGGETTIAEQKYCMDQVSNKIAPYFY
jgi:hypothetical protein